MSDLTRFRDHCRKMATAGPTDQVKVDLGAGRTGILRGPMCTDEDRALWLRLADEVDAYIVQDPDVVDLALDEPGDTLPFPDGCDCTELCSMGPTCPGGMLAGLPGSGCWRTE